MPILSRISNQTDFDMSRAHPQIELTFVRRGQKKPTADLIILPDSKHVSANLELPRQHGWDEDIARHLRYDGMVLGICGGFQMLGRNIHDPTSIESTIGSSQALGYLPINTRLQIEKQLIHSTGKLMLQANVHNNDMQVTASGYQIHVGHIERKDDLNAFALLNDAQQGDTKLNDAQLDGSVSADNQVAGSYLHGMFDSPDSLQHIIAWAGANIDEAETYARQQEHELDPLADACMAHILAENTRIYH